MISKQISFDNSPISQRRNFSDHVIEKWRLGSINWPFIVSGGTESGVVGVRK